MSKKFLYLTIIGLLIFNPCLKAEGLVAVFVNGDKTVKDEYKKLLQSEMEERLVECGCSIVEHSEEYLEMKRAYNDYLKGSSVSEFAFDEIESEKLADKFCAVYIRKLSEGSYRIEVTLTKYGQTDSKMKKSYPSLGEAKCNIEVNTNEIIKKATIELLYKLELISSERRNEMMKECNRPRCNALAASAFIPGAGQFYKHDWVGGSAFLISELALVAGGTTCYFLKQKHYKNWSECYYGHDGLWIDNEKKSEKIFNISMIACYGLATALHIGNMVHAWYAQGTKHLIGFNITPAIIPMNDFFLPSYAMGVGLQLNI